MANDKDFILKNAVEVGGPTNVTLGTITGNAVNLSTGNYFKDTLAANTTYTISNAGDVQSFQLEVTGGAVFNLASSAYDNKSFSVATQETIPNAVYFKPDGTKMYICGNSALNVFEYNLSTAWDVSTASYLQTFALTISTSHALSFKYDGTRMYTLEGTTVVEYTLSTAWDVTTCSSTSTFSVSGQDTSPQGLFIKSDGTKMYVVGTTNDAVNEYTLSTAWLASSATFIQAFSIASQETTPGETTFSVDGTKMFVVGITSDAVFQYTLATAFDLSTASYDSVSFSVAGQEATPRGMYLKPDNSKMYIVGYTNDTVYQYTTTTDATITWPSSIEFAGGVAPAAPATGETDIFTFSTDDGGTSYIGTKTADNLS